VTSLGGRCSFAGMQNQRAIYPYLSPALPRIFAHRGFASVGAAENTIEAFRAALELGATHIESDIQVTKDGVPVLFHDVDLLRVAGLPRKIGELSLSELLALELKEGGRVPTLEAALRALPEARFNLDLKVAQAIASSASVIRALKAEDRVLVTSFSDSRRGQALRLFDAPVASSAGSARVLALWLAAKLHLGPWVRLLARPVQALQIPTAKGPIRFDSPAFIAQMTVAGLELHYWTINDAAEMLRLIGLGAHGIVTDRTDLAVKTLRMAS
jgi:glycerophosphoryl diester phosphodiesterase